MLSRQKSMKSVRTVMNSIMNGNERQRKVGTYILENLDSEVSFMGENEQHNIT